MTHSLFWKSNKFFKKTQISEERRKTTKSVKIHQVWIFFVNKLEKSVTDTYIIGILTNHLNFDPFFIIFRHVYRPKMGTRVRKWVHIRYYCWKKYSISRSRRVNHSFIIEPKAADISCSC